MTESPNVGIPGDALRRAQSEGRTHELVRRRTARVEAAVVTSTPIVRSPAYGAARAGSITSAPRLACERGRLQAVVSMPGGAPAAGSVAPTLAQAQAPALVLHEGEGQALAQLPEHGEWDGSSASADACARRYVLGVVRELADDPSALERVARHVGQAMRVALAEALQQPARRDDGWPIRLIEERIAVRKERP